MGILLSYYEQYILVESTCQLIDIIETKRTMTCDVMTLQKSFKCIKASVSLDYLNQTCRRAMVFRSLSDAEETKFQCSANECDGPWDVNNFVSGLGNSGQLRCSYNPENPGRAYVTQSSFIPFMVLIVVVLVVIGVLVWRSLDFISETSMEETIKYLQNNDLKRVKKCFNQENVNEEIWQNNIVLSPLAIAAQCGHTEIMEYLLAVGADINYTEDETGKTILHFACQSDRPNVISYFIEKGLSVNAVTSMNETPLLIYILYTDNPSIGTIQSFILEGADVSAMGASNCTVLHHTCMNSRWPTDVKRQVIELFIKAGCICHSGIGLLNISPLSILLAQHEFKLCELLIEAGYEVRKDKTLPYIIQYLHDIPDEQKLTLEMEIESVAPLKRLCRTVIRDALGSNRGQNDINLPIPKTLIQFLKLEGIVNVSDN